MTYLCLDHKRRPCAAPAVHPVVALKSLVRSQITVLSCPDRHQRTNSMPGDDRGLNHPPRPPCVALRSFRTSTHVQARPKGSLLPRAVGSGCVLAPNPRGLGLLDGLEILPERNSQNAARVSGRQRRGSLASPTKCRRMEGGWVGEILKQPPSSAACDSRCIPLGSYEKGSSLG